MYVHNNLRLLSRNSAAYNEETKMRDIGGHGFDSFQGAGVLYSAALYLDETTMEVVLFADDGEENNEEVIGLALTSF